MPKKSSRTEKEPPKWVAQTQKDMAMFFGISLITARNWMRRAEELERSHEIDNPFKKVKSVGYDLAAIFRWYDLYRQHGKQPGRPKSKPEEDEFTTKERQAKLSKLDVATELATIELRHKRNELVSRQAVKDEVTRFVHAIRRRLELIPEQMGVYFTGNERAVVISEMEAQMRTILIELSHLKDEASEIE